jgi:hypothetical protein
MSVVGHNLVPNQCIKLNAAKNVVKDQEYLLAAACNLLRLLPHFDQASYFIYSDATLRYLR